MGMDLNGAGGYQHFSNTSWCKMLELAYKYGWKPAVTELGQWIDPSTGELHEQLSPDPDECDVNYFTNASQWVTDEDAAHIADALEQALVDMSDFDTGEKWVEYESTNLPTSPVERSLVEQGFAVSASNESLSPLEFFSGERKQQVRDFIAYCRAGAFFIA